MGWQGLMNWAPALVLILPLPLAGRLTAGEVSGVQYIRNGDFRRAGDDGSPDGWRWVTHRPSTAPEFAVVTDSSGVRWARMRLAKHGASYGALTQRVEGVKPGEWVLLHYRVRSVEYLGENLLAGGVQIVEPPGGHAVYIDAGSFCPQIPPEGFPGQAIVCALYRHAGIRAVEIGSLMFGSDGRRPDLELVRLAVPRRVYTQSHLDYVVEAVLDVYAERDKLKPMEIVEAPPQLRHFTARLKEAEV